MFRLLVTHYYGIPYNLFVYGFLRTFKPLLIKIGLPFLNLYSYLLSLKTMPNYGELFDFIFFIYVIHPPIY